MRRIRRVSWKLLNGRGARQFARAFSRFRNDDSREGINARAHFSGVAKGAIALVVGALPPMRAVLPQGQPIAVDILALRMADLAVRLMTPAIEGSWIVSATWSEVSYKPPLGYYNSDVLALRL